MLDAAFRSGSGGSERELRTGGLARSSEICVIRRRLRSLISEVGMKRKGSTFARFSTQ